MRPFDRLESDVRSYIRSFPVVFERAKDSRMYAEDGTAYIDFFAGAGALNYGHNPSDLQAALVQYISGDGITHSLDMATSAKRRFMMRFDEVIVKPRDLTMKLLFPGPTGTNAVEAALKLARKATGRSRIMSFTNGFHGMTLGSLALTGNRMKRHGAGIPLANVDVMPFDGYHGDGVDTLEMIERMITDTSSGFDVPAAFVLEPIQAEGGVHVASREWMEGLSRLAHEHGILLIVDDIQVGCGRTGTFFSFEEMDVQPDIVCLSKSLSGYGLPMAMVLLRPELDVFAPGEHNGTFRGHMPAFVTATAALERWTDQTLEHQVKESAAHITDRLHAIAKGTDIEVRGRGLIQGLAFQGEHAGDLADEVSRVAFEHGLIIETAGPDGEVVKLLPPIVIDRETLNEGLDILATAVDAVLGRRSVKLVKAAASESAEVSA